LKLLVHLLVLECFVLVLQLMELQLSIRCILGILIFSFLKLNRMGMLRKLLLE